MLKKGNQSIANYFMQFSSLADTLATVDHPLNDNKVISVLLVGLGPEYDSFFSLAITCAEPLSLENLYDHLLAHEKWLEQHQAVVDLIVTRANIATRFLISWSWHSQKFLIL